MRPFIGVHTTQQEEAPAISDSDEENENTLNQCLEEKQPTLQRFVPILGSDLMVSFFLRLKKEVCCVVSLATH